MSLEIVVDFSTNCKEILTTERNSTTERDFDLEKMMYIHISPYTLRDNKNTQNSSLKSGFVV